MDVRFCRDPRAGVTASYRFVGTEESTGSAEMWWVHLEVTDESVKVEQGTVVDDRRLYGRSGAGKAARQERASA